MSSAIKSSLSACLKWQSGDATFRLAVPNKPAQRDLIAYLRERAGEPCAEYIDIRAQGRDALQWNLSLREFGAIWRA